MHGYWSNMNKPIGLLSSDRFYSEEEHEDMCELEIDGDCLLSIDYSVSEKDLEEAKEAVREDVIRVENNRKVEESLELEHLGHYRILWEEEVAKHNEVLCINKQLIKSIVALTSENKRLTNNIFDLRNELCTEFVKDDIPWMFDKICELQISDVKRIQKRHRDRSNKPLPMPKNLPPEIADIFCQQINPPYRKIRRGIS